jgi:hypothetical protein
MTQSKTAVSPNKMAAPVVKSPNVANAQTIANSPYGLLEIRPRGALLDMKHLIKCAVASTVRIINWRPGYK